MSSFSGVSFLFFWRPVPCCHSCRKVYRRCFNSSTPGVMLVLFAFWAPLAREPYPLRLFAPHLCHAACRIVVMAEDTKSLVGAWWWWCVGVSSVAVTARGRLTRFIFYILFYASIWNLGVNFAGGGWCEELKRGVIVKGVCVCCGRPFQYVHKAV